MAVELTTTMADPLYEILTPYFAALDTPSRPLLTDHVTSKYLNHLTGLSLADVTTTEPSSLSHHLHTLLRSLQALSKRSQRSIISSASHLSNISNSLPQLLSCTKALQHAIPDMDSTASAFADKYRRVADAENDALDRRKRALLLASAGDRISSILDLPTLLSSAISAASQPGATGISINYTSALDLYAHTKRLGALYPTSPLVQSVLVQVETEMQLLTSNLITSLQAPNIKMAGTMRTIGWLRRVAPELDEGLQLERQSGRLDARTYTANIDGAVGALFLVCRLTNLFHILEALEPLRELADQETKDRTKLSKGNEARQQEQSHLGHQTERYLKRYIEIFREQTFGIVSMYKNIFPSTLLVPGSDTVYEVGADPRLSPSDNLLLPLPSPLATFPSHLIDMLFDTLHQYLPNVTDRTSRDSLMTQVLYCAGSLGRLGGDFSMMLALLDNDESEDDDEVSAHEPTWIEVMKKHRVQANKLELLASGATTGAATGKALPAKEQFQVAVASP